jgi:type I restriction enzyme S subunit
MTSAQFPETWADVPLNEICRPRQWKTISTKDLTPTGYTVYGANGIIGLYSEYTHEKPTLMITCRGATCGNLHISKPFSYINGNAMALDNLQEEVCSQRFLYYFLKSRGFEDVISGSAQPQITGEGLSKIVVPLAPLNEQKHIAEKLDSLLTRVDSCQSHLERVPQILKRFRQSVLAAATSGRLTEDWREERGVSLDRDWQEVRFGDYVNNHDGRRVPISEKIRSKRRGQYPYYGASGIIDSIDNFTHDGKFLLIGEDGANLLTRSKPIAFIAKGRIWVNNHAHVLTCKNGEPEEYLSYYINAIDLSPYVSGSAQPKLNQQNMNNIVVPVPPLEEQTEIVRRVEKLFAYAERLEARYTSASEHVERLTPSLLAKAFRGELVRQE